MVNPKDIDIDIAGNAAEEEQPAATPLASCLVASLPLDRLVGLVVKASASRAEDPRFKPRLRRDFFRVESYQ